MCNMKQKMEEAQQKAAYQQLVQQMFQQQQEAALIEQQARLKRGGAMLSSSEVARQVGDKSVTTKKTVSSLRVPIKNKLDTDTVGATTSDDNIVGLNIPI